MPRAAIRDIDYYLPETEITNEHLSAENPSWDMAVVEQRSGVVRRRVARQDQTALDLALEAAERLLQRHSSLREELDALLFCTQSPDYIMPPNSSVLHQRLELRENVFALDFNLACSGYVYGLAMAQGLIASGSARNVLLVNADTYSKYIHPQDRAARVLFGDGAAVTWIDSSDDGNGVLDVLCATGGKHHERFIIRAGGCRLPRSAETSREEVDRSGNIRSAENIEMDGMGILTFVNSKVPAQVRELLQRNALESKDIDLFVFHQASKMALDSLARLLSIEETRMFSNLREIGNTVSASIPIALKDALDAGRVKRGDRVVLSGFGVGLSWASALVRV